MNHYQQPQYAMSPRSEEQEPWDTSASHPTQFAFTASHHPVASEQYYQAGHAVSSRSPYQQQPYIPASSMDAYDVPYPQTLPHPAYGQGAPSNPAAYHYGTAYAYTSPDLLSPTWSTTGDYPPSYAYPQAGSPGSSGRDSSPNSDTGTTKPQTSSTTGKKFVCHRVSEQSQTTCSRGFKRKADLQRHIDNIHDKAKQEKFDCTYNKCQRKGEGGFLRKDHLREHLRNFHHQALPKRQKRADVEDEGEDETLEENVQYAY